MTLQQIMERLLRSRLYRQRVRIETHAGERHHVVVRELRHEASRSFVVVTSTRPPRSAFCIPLEQITAVRRAEAPPPGEGRVA